MKITNKANCYFKEKLNMKGNLNSWGNCKLNYYAIIKIVTRKKNRIFHYWWILKCFLTSSIQGIKIIFIQKFVLIIVFLKKFNIGSHYYKNNLIINTNIKLVNLILILLLCLNHLNNPLVFINNLTQKFQKLH